MSKQGLSIVSCCAPMSTDVVSAERAGELAKSFKALGDPVRLRLLSMIATSPEGEVCVCDLTGSFELSAPTISHHLKVLREAGLIDCERRGTWVYYWSKPDVLDALSSVLATKVAQPS